MTKKTSSPTNEVETKDEAVQKINSIPFYFEWTSLQPDARAYKPSNPYIIPEETILVEVRVPLDSKLIVNAQDISMQQLSNQEQSEPILTVLGMRYIIDQFESAMKPVEAEKETTEKEDDWDDEVETEETTKPAKASNDDWDDEVETDQPGAEKPEEDFDEDWS